MLDAAKAQRRLLYTRPKPARALAKAERKELLHDYFGHYREIAATNPTLLSQKLPREVFANLLDVVGVMLLEHTKVKSVIRPCTKSGPGFSAAPLSSHLRSLDRRKNTREGNV